MDKIGEKIRFIIKKYKENFVKINKEERYKWEAIAWYKKYWDINAENWAEMVETSFKKAYNLLNSGMYFAGKMLVEFSKEAPEKVRELFRILYNEELSFELRYEKFAAVFKEYTAELQNRDGKKYNSYQDAHAISVYLAFEYPEKYFIYKAGIYDKMSARIGFVGETTKLGKFKSHQQMCEMILREIQDDQELQELSRNRLDETCYNDEAFHLLALDIAYYGAAYMKESDFSQGADTQSVQYWPSLEEYNPNLSVEDWQSFLKEDAKEYPSSLQMLKTMLELGGEATCKKLSEVLGGHASSYIGLATGLGKRVKKKYDLPPCMGKMSVIFPLLF